MATARYLRHFPRLGPQSPAFSHVNCLPRSNVGLMLHFLSPHLLQLGHCDDYSRIHRWPEMAKKSSIRIASYCDIQPPSL